MQERVRGRKTCFFLSVIAGFGNVKGW
jgi:hypothetical protein